MRITITILMLIMLNYLAGQTLVISSILVDEETSLPIEGASVYLFTDLSDFCRTDTRGEFYFEVPNHARNNYDGVRLYIAKDGYEPIEKSFRVPLVPIKMKKKEKRGFFALVKDEDTKVLISGAQVRLPSGEIIHTDAFGMAFVEVEATLNIHEPIQLGFGKTYHYEAVAKTVTMKDALNGYFVLLRRKKASFRELDERFHSMLNVIHRSPDETDLNKGRILELIELFDFINHLEIDEYEQRIERDEVYPAIAQHIHKLGKEFNPKVSRGRQEIKIAHDKLYQEYELKYDKFESNQRRTIDGTISDLEILLNLGIRILYYKKQISQLGLDYQKEIVADSEVLKRIVEFGQKTIKDHRSRMSANQVIRLETVLNKSLLRIERTLQN